MVKKITWNLFFLLVSSLSSFAQFIDHFSDYDFSQSPTWIGDINHFEVQRTAVTLPLHLIAPPASDTSSLSTSSHAILNATWQWYTALAFNPSASNYAKIYLVADEANLEQELNGYYILIGGADDDISLYKQNQNTHTKIIDGPDGFLDKPANVLGIKVTRDNLGNWEVFTDSTLTNHFTLLGASLDNTFNTSLYFGVSCIYSATRSDKFYFDDFVVTGSAPTDSIPPQITALHAQDTHTLQIEFNEPLDSTSALYNMNYVLNDTQHPNILTLTPDKKAITLYFNSSFQAATLHHLSLRNVKDVYGNTSFIDTNFYYYELDTAHLHQIVFTEIMADPTPEIGLPDIEYIEIYNASQKAFNLQNYQLVNSAISRTLPNQIIYPNEYIILCDDQEVIEMSSYGKVIGIASFVSLSNVKDSLTLINPLGEMIDLVAYHDAWHSSPDKKQGGWSLEKKYFNSLCSDHRNWASSEENVGGTPGKINSIISAQTEAPLVTETETEDSLCKIIFSEPISAAYTPSIHHFSTTPTMPIHSVTKSDDQSISLNFSESLSHQTEYTLNVDSVAGCSGAIKNQQSLPFYHTEQASATDMIINEVLFNPIGNGSDFIEIYNRSAKYFSLKNLKISNGKDTSTLITKNHLLKPHEYIAFTSDSQNIKQTYPQANMNRIFTIQNMPPFNNDAGTVMLFRKDLYPLDQMYFSEKMHFDLLKDVEGISLERISPEAPSTNTNNWHSASETCGFATPGYENSQFIPDIHTEQIIHAEPETISPDNDGLNDVLSIHYQLNKPNYIANITIYSLEGVIIKKLVNNQLLGTQGVFLWNGLSDVGITPATGLYFTYAEFFSADGQVLYCKTPFIVAYK